MGCGADTEANALIASLTAGEDFTIPSIDLSGPEFQFPGGPGGPLYQIIKPLTIDQLTTGEVGGSGVFDQLMKSMGAHLTKEMEKGRITANEYSKVYIQGMESALGAGVQFLLGRDEAFWNAQSAQVQAFTARVQMETAKVELASQQLTALNMRAGFALTKLKLASESVTYCTAQYNLDKMLPQQFINLGVQEKLLKEQVESQRAQTADVRTDGFSVAGLMGKQKDLSSQQILSYQRDSEVKAAKLFTDAWITMKTIDEGLLPPSNFQNTSLDAVLATLKTNNHLGA